MILYYRGNGKKPQLEEKHAQARERLAAMERKAAEEAEALAQAQVQAQASEGA